MVKAVLLVVGLAGLVLASGASATGGGTSVRILAPGDAYVAAAWSACTEPYGQGGPDCLLVRDTLGYSGATAAMIPASADHIGHALICSVTSSATGVVGNALPYPANLVLADSIALAYDNDGDTMVDEKHGGRTLEGGPTPTVSGEVRARTFVLNEGGFDVTVDCGF